MIRLFRIYNAELWKSAFQMRTPIIHIPNADEHWSRHRKGTFLLPDYRDRILTEMLILVD